MLNSTLATFPEPEEEEGTPGAAQGSEDPNSGEEDGTKAKTKKKKKTVVKGDPIGFPEVLCVFTSIMWLMQAIGSWLKLSNWTWHAYKDAYNPLPKRAPPKPPELKRRMQSEQTKLLLLGLGVAVAMLGGMPNLQLHSLGLDKQKLRKAMRHPGSLKASKLSAEELEKVKTVLGELPTELMQPGQIKPLIMDTGASFMSTGDVTDFVPGTLTPLEQPLTMDGIAGNMVAEKAGIARFEYLGDDGSCTTPSNQTELEHTDDAYSGRTLGTVGSRPGLMTSS